MTSTPSLTAPSASRPARAGDARRVAVIGGGASGTLTALNLLRSGGRAEVTVFEASGRLGYGVAYSTTDRRHLLNVRAGNMSALPDVPDDLVEWARSTGRGLPSDFLPRCDYAAYLSDRLATAVADSPGRLVVVGERVTDVERSGEHLTVTTEQRCRGGYDAIVLAYGNAAPRPLSAGGKALPDAAWHVPNPWDVRFADALPDDATVVLVGTGLTAVDTAITLLEDARHRRVVMVSRHGLLPYPHVEEDPPAWATPVPSGPLTADGLAAHVADQVAAAERHGLGWRAVVDGLRAPTQSIWMRLDAEERRRFLSRYARAWEVRRHRMAPGVAARIDDYRREGRLEVRAGGLRSLTVERVRPTAEFADGSLTVDAVVNCTGPQLDITRSDNPLLLALQRRGLIAPDPLHLGVDSTPEGVVLDARGEPVPWLFTVGPPRKGVLYETSAIPEIRVQAAQVAQLLTTA